MPPKLHYASSANARAIRCLVPGPVSPPGLSCYGGGDHVGPVVSLASRLVDAAQPDAVLVNETYHSLLEQRHPEIA